MLSRDLRVPPVVSTLGALLFVGGLPWLVVGFVVVVIIVFLLFVAVIWSRKHDSAHIRGTADAFAVLARALAPWGGRL